LKEKPDLFKKGSFFVDWLEKTKDMSYEERGKAILK